MSEAEHDVLNALLDGEMDEWNRRFHELGSRPASRLMAVAALYACLIQFPEDVGSDEIASYVRHLKSIFPPERKISTVQTEAVIRAALGDTDALDGIPPLDLLAAQVTITFAVGHEHDLRGPAREKFVAEVLDALA